MYPWIIQTSSVVAIPVIRKYNVSMDYPWIIQCSSPQCIHGLSTVIHESSDIQCGSHPSNSEIQCIHGLSMDHPTSNVVATPVIQKYNVSMDYPWIIHGSSDIQCSSPQCIHGLSTKMDTNIVETTNNKDSVKCNITLVLDEHSGYYK